VLCWTVIVIRNHPKKQKPVGSYGRLSILSWFVLIFSMRGPYNCIPLMLSGKTCHHNICLFHLHHFITCAIMGGSKFTDHLIGVDGVRCTEQIFTKKCNESITLFELWAIEVSQWESSAGKFKQPVGGGVAKLTYLGLESEMKRIDCERFSWKTSKIVLCETSW